MAEEEETEEVITMQAEAGGASHVATANGILSSLSSNRNAILLVAGGGRTVE